jgi:hypothetical protein
MGKNYTKLQYIIPNGHKLYLTDVKYANIFHSKALQKYTQIGIFGIKIKTSGNPA